MTTRKIAIEVDMDSRKLLDEAAKDTTALKAVKEEAGSLGRQVDETSRDMDGLAISAVAAKKEVGGLGDKARGTERDLSLLDRRIASTKRSVSALGFEFAATGDKVAGKKFGQQQGLLSDLERLRGELKGLEDDGSSIGDLLGSIGSNRNSSPILSTASAIKVPFGLSPSFGPTVIAALVGAAAAASPMIGAAIGGAVTGAVGLGGIAGGIFAASKNPVVRSAAQEFGDVISQDFFGGGAAFIEPIRQSLGILAADFQKADFGDTWAKVAPFVTKVATGVGDLVDHTMPGLDAALDRSGPFINELARGLSRTGFALSSFLDDVSSSRGGIDGLRDLFILLNGALVGTGKAINGLEDTYDGFLITSQKVTGTLADGLGVLNPWTTVLKTANALFGSLQQGSDFAADSVKGLGDSFAGSTERAKALADAITAADKAESEFMDHQLARSNADIAVAQDFADLNDQLVKGKKNWDLTTQAGRDNQKQINDTIDDLKRQRDAAIEAGDGSAQATLQADQAYDRQIQKLLEVAKQAGDTKAQLDLLNKTYTIDIVLDYKVLNQVTKANALDRASQNALGTRAAGGPVGPGSWIVGERRPEVLTLGAGQYGHVTPSVQQWADKANNNYNPAVAWNGGGSSGGAVGGTVRHVVDFQINGTTVRKLLITDAFLRGQANSTIAAAYP